jgi:hypothetical protein
MNQSGADKCDLAVGAFGARKCGRKAATLVVSKDSGRVVAKRCRAHNGHLTASDFFEFRKVARATRREAK